MMVLLDRFSYNILQGIKVSEWLDKVSCFSAQWQHLFFADSEFLQSIDEEDEEDGDYVPEN